jgi:hypothetical protein
MEFEIHNNQDETKGSYYIEENGKKVAEMFYTRTGPDRIIINHTEVKLEYKGKGAGEALVRKAVDDAREQKFSIIPLCVFANAIFIKNKELRDVL